MRDRLRRGRDLAPAEVAEPLDRVAGRRVGVAGDVKLDTIETTNLTVKAQAGQVLPWAVRKVYSSANGTTATDLVTIKLP